VTAKTSIAVPANATSCRDQVESEEPSRLNFFDGRHPHNAARATLAFLFPGSCGNDVYSRFQGRADLIFLKSDHLWSALAYPGPISSTKMSSGMLLRPVESITQLKNITGIKGDARLYAIRVGGNGDRSNSWPVPIWPSMMTWPTRCQTSKRAKICRRRLTSRTVVTSSISPVFRPGGNAGR